MAVDERMWRRAMGALETAIGEDEAGALMARLLEEPARREDLHGAEERIGARITQVETRLDARITQVEMRLDARITQVEERLDERLHATREFLDERIAHGTDQVVAVMRGELNSQLRSLLFGFVGLQATIGTFIIAFVRFAI